MLGPTFDLAREALSACGHRIAELVGLRGVRLVEQIAGLVDQCGGVARGLRDELVGIRDGLILELSGDRLGCILQRRVDRIVIAAAELGVDDREPRVHQRLDERSRLRRALRDGCASLASGSHDLVTLCGGLLRRLSAEMLARFAQAFGGVVRITPCQCGLHSRCGRQVRSRGAEDRASGGGALIERRCELHGLRGPGPVHLCLFTG